MYKDRAYVFSNDSVSDSNIVQYLQWNLWCD